MSIPNKAKLEDFDVGSLLGEGTFAKVHVAVQRATNLKFALKIVDKAFVQKHQKVNTVINERNVLQHLSGHPGIPRLYYTFQDHYSLYYVLELAEGGELYDALQVQPNQTFSLDSARRIASELCEILCYVHAKGVAHRDVKPSNILISASGHVLLTDFGTAKKLTAGEMAAEAELASQLLQGHGLNLDSPSSSLGAAGRGEGELDADAAADAAAADAAATSAAYAVAAAPASSASAGAESSATGHAAADAADADVSAPMDPETALSSEAANFYRRAHRSVSFVGTAQYVSPEVLRGRKVGRSADWWAFGVVLYQLLCGTVPFSGVSEYLTFKAILNSPLTFPADADADFRDLVSRLLVPEPASRLGMRFEDGPAVIAKHPFFAPCHAEATAAASTAAVAASALPAAAALPGAAAPWAATPLGRLLAMPVSPEHLAALMADGGGAGGDGDALDANARSAEDSEADIFQPSAAAAAPTCVPALASAFVSASPAPLTLVAASRACEIRSLVSAVLAALRAAGGPAAAALEGALADAGVTAFAVTVGPISKAGRWSFLGSILRKKRTLVLLSPVTRAAAAAGRPAAAAPHRSAHAVFAYVDTGDVATLTVKGFVPIVGARAAAEGSKGDFHVHTPQRTYDMTALETPDVFEVCVAVVGSGGTGPDADSGLGTVTVSSVTRARRSTRALVGSEAWVHDINAATVLAD